MMRPLPPPYPQLRRAGRAGLPAGPADTAAAASGKLRLHPAVAGFRFRLGIVGGRDGRTDPGRAGSHLRA